MKKKIIVLLMTMTMAASVLAGCGADSSNVADNKKTETSAKSDSANEAENSKDDSKNNAGTSKKEASQEVNPFLGPNGLMFASEDDVVINISGVDVPMTSTRDELIALIEENNWEIEYRSVNINMIEGFKTPDGEVYAEVQDLKKDGTGEELTLIDFDPSTIDLSKVSLNGVTLDKVETLKNSSNLVREDNNYFTISIADYTTLTVKYSRDGELYLIMISRQIVRD